MPPVKLGRIALALATALLVAALVALLHAGDVARGWHEDDFGFLRLSQHSLPELWRCDLGWFYRPVFLSWFWLLLRAFSEDSRAFHIANLVTHALNACLLGLLVYRLTRRPWAASGSALVFVLVMRHNQAVWWVSAASATLMSLFMLLALLGWHTFLQQRRPVWYGLTLVACALALGAKEEAVVLVAALPLLELTTGGPRPYHRAWAAYIPLALLGTAWLALVLRAHAAYVQVPADFMDYDARSYIEAVSPAALPARLPSVAGVLNNAWHGVLPLCPLSVAGMLGLVCVVLCLRRHRATLWFLAWLGLLALPASLTLGLSATMGRFLYAPTLAGTASGLLALAVLDPRRSWTGKAILAALAALLVPNDLRVMRDFYLPLYTTDAALATAIVNWAALGLALGAVAWMWRTRRIAGRQLAMVAALSVVTVLIALTPEGWKSLWWLGAMVCCGLLMHRDGWWHGALSALLLLPHGGTALPMFVAMLALWPGGASPPRPLAGVTSFHPLRAAGRSCASATREGPSPRPANWPRSR